MKLRFLPVAAAVAALTATRLWPEVPGAEAHTAQVTASCTQGLQVHLRYYDADTKLSIVVDGDQASAVHVTFTGDYDYVYSLQVPATPHTYVVTIDNVGTIWDSTHTGEVDCSPPPTTPTPTTAPPPTTTGLPATPPCPFPGKGIYDWNDVECVESPKTDVGTPAVELPATPVRKTPAFTG